MLFRRFSILTVLIALAAIIFINIVQVSAAHDREFAVGDRLKQWELLDKKQACPNVDKLCRNAASALKKV